MQKFVETNGIRLAYLDHGGDGPILILMHGLTANSHCFDGLIAAGLNQHVHVLSVDLRGRGLSDKPATGYTPDDHMNDILGMMDALGLESAIIGGHSFGGLLTMLIGAQHPERVQKMVIMDAGMMHPKVRELIAPSIARLGVPVESWEIYHARIKNTPYYHGGFWDPMLDSYYAADIETLPDGRVKSRSTPEAIAAAVDGILTVDWPTVMPKASAPAILIHGPEGAGPGDTPPVLADDGAQQTLSMLPNATYHRVQGNHLTMLFGDNAKLVTQIISDFVNG